MSALLQFPLSRVRGRNEAAATGPAQVIIFPGVMIERTAKKTPKQPAPRGTRRRSLKKSKGL